MLRHLLEWFVDPPVVVLSARRVHFYGLTPVEPDTSSVVCPAVPANAPESARIVARLQQQPRSER